jgi:hypothetical protein
MQALARGDFESLNLQIHVQMLVKVVCFVSHKSLFACALACSIRRHTSAFVGIRQRRRSGELGCAHVC